MPMNKKLRSKWADAGYGDQMGSAEVVPPPPSNLIRAYHLTSATHALNDIALRRLKIARISDLNDPFELMAVSLRERRMRDEVGALKFSYDGHTGLLCFSSDWTDPVLWSHYGDKHRGACLGFNLVRNQAERVEYQDKRLLAQLPNDDSAGHITKGLEEQLLRTKFKHWEYESELRLCVRLQESLKEGSLYFQPFTEALCVAEVILGERCTLTLESVRALTNAIQPTAVTFKARLAVKHYKVVPNEDTVP